MARWPIREALEAYKAMLRAAALDQYNRERAEYFAIAPHLKKNSGVEPPVPPPILTGASRNDRRS